ncbi:ParA family protein [Ruminococcaceae bacterium OttesenSCG-928-L11]|nr:ParA family protein [Ruminococcaceae bacterium OttesenSCG-928-L11]
MKPNELLDFLSQDVIIVTGHYGSGKTNFAINLAVDLRAAGHSVTLADLDIVNPYFRSADFKEEAERLGIDFVASAYANSNLDIPSLSAGVDAKIGAGGKLIIDVGGDDAGAYALGRYSARIKETGYTMLYVVNAYRYLTREPEEALELLRDIETASRLKATHIVNNSNLSWQTEVSDVTRSVPYAQSVAELAGIPLAATAARRDVAEQLSEKQGFYPVDIYVKVPWNPGE